MTKNHAWQELGGRDIPSKGFKALQGLNTLNLHREQKVLGNWGVVMAQGVGKGQIIGGLGDL